MAPKPIVLDPAFNNLPDDTEETLQGDSLHQDAITLLAIALTLCGPRRGLSWFIGHQIKMIILRQGAHGPYMPIPDIIVHPTLTNASRSSVILDTDGPPALAIEVASPSTAWSSDLNLTDQRGKPGVYESIGIPEYLVFDPTSELLPEQVWARRLGPHGYEPWEATGEGRWVSQALGGIAFARQGVLLRVYDQDGRLVPTSEEMADPIDERDRRLAERDQQIAALQAALRRQNTE